KKKKKTKNNKKKKKKKEAKQGVDRQKTVLTEHAQRKTRHRKRSPIWIEHRRWMPGRSRCRAPI
ncbi:hypothetical protein J9A58_26385, partial [Klebsiella pneumoniae]